MVQGIRAAQSVMEKQTWQEKPPGPVEFKNGPTDVSDHDADANEGEKSDESFIEDRTGGSR
jgi:hypothetical protein